MADDLIILDGQPTLAGQVGKLDLALTAGGEALPFALLDCHDGSIRQSGSLLIEAGPSLLLFQNGRTLTQPGRRAGNFVADLADGPVKDALKETSPLRSLMVIGTGSLSRAQLALVDDEGKTRARADLCLLSPSGQGRALTLARPQALRGYDKAGAALAKYLRGTGPARGHAIADIAGLLFPEHVPYDPKPEVMIAPDDAAYDAANGIIRTCLTVARRNEAGIITDLDSEFLHDYRVALRKIRSVISLFRGVYDTAQTADLKCSFCDLMAPTGRLRDLDVYLLGRRAYFELLPETLHDGLALMFEIFTRERQQEHKKIVRLLKSPDYHQRIAAIEAVFTSQPGPARGPDADHQAHDYARRLIWHRYRKVCKIASRIDDDTADEQIHALRINCKKLRYLMEFFAPLFPRRRFRKLLAPLKELQENLGLFNDYSVQQIALREFLQHHPAAGMPQERAMAASIGALIGVLHQRQLHERARVVSSFAHFDSPAIRDEFASLFHRKGA